MLGIKGLNQDLLQRTLHNLWEVCSERGVLPGSCGIPRQFAKLTEQPFVVSRYAEVWSGQPSPGEGNDGTMDVCIKVIKLKGVHRVGEAFRHSPGNLLDSILQEFYGDIALWMKLDHPNILRCFGVTNGRPQPVMKWMPNDHPQLVTKWMSNGEAIEYVRENKHVNRVCLVSVSTIVTREVNPNHRSQRS